VFGSALILDSPSVVLPKLNILMSDNEATLYWNGAGFVLQQTSEFSSNSSNWVDVAAVATNSPVVISNTGTAFYRLRK
jgi:hypothetical protein